MTDKQTEEKIFKEEVSEEELKAVSGAGHDCLGSPHDCAENHFHNIYERGFPDCQATVEDGSWCSSADACFSSAIEYVGMKECKKAWK